MLPQRITSRPWDVKHHGFYAPKQSIILLNIFISLKQTRNKLVVGITIVKKKETNNIREY